MKTADLHTLANGLMLAAIPRQQSATTLADKVDALALLRADIARLTQQADEIRTELEDAGLTTIEGAFFRASFAQCKGRTITDWQAIAQRFKPSAQLIRAHTKQGAETTRMTLTAKPTTH